MKAIDVVKFAKKPKELKKFFKKNQKDITQKDYDDFLYIACSFNVRELAIALYEFNESHFNFSNDIGFQKFCQEGKTEFVRLFHDSQYTDISNNNNQAFINTCRSGNIDLIHFFLKHSNSNIYDQNHQAFIEICQYETPEIIEVIKWFLKQSECNPSAQNNSALTFALYYENLKVIDILLQDKRVNPKQDNEVYIQCLKNAIQICKDEEEYDGEKSLTKILNTEIIKHNLKQF